MSFYVSGLLSHGATFEAGEAARPSVGTIASVAMNDPLFEMMTDEIDLDLPLDRTVSPSTSFSMTINCTERREAVVVWKPLFDHFEGRFHPSGDEGHIWVPMDIELSTENFDFNCLG